MRILTKTKKLLYITNKSLVKKNISLLVIFLLFVGCETTGYKNKLPSPPSHAILVKEIPIKILLENIPTLRDYMYELKNCLNSSLPVILLSENDITKEQSQAQKIALKNPGFLRSCWETKTKKPVHSEIMQIFLTANNLMQVEMYNYYYNSTTVAQIDIHKEVVISVKHISAMQPIPSKRLKQIAVKVALQYPEVRKILGVTSNIMSNEINTTVEESKCERSRHLSVSPVFNSGESLLSTVVDIHSWQLIGIKETPTFKKKKPEKLTERSIQNEYIMSTYCNHPKRFRKNNWEITYVLTKSDGVEIKDVKYKGENVIKSAKLVDWHVNYSFGDGYGFSDAMGCPMYSSAAVVAFKDAEIQDIHTDKGIGFTLIQDFRSPVWPLSCNYRYCNKFTFYENGIFEISGINMGLGCGEGAIYKPVFRIDLATGDQDFEKLESWSDMLWKAVEKENWFLQKKQNPLHQSGGLFRIFNKKTEGYYVVSQAFSKNNIHVNKAYYYFSKFHSNKTEGQTNMPTIGPYNNTDHQNGPEKFISPTEFLEEKDMVIWYVPEMHNDNTPDSKYCWVDITIEQGKERTRVWPGEVGLAFIPFQLSENNTH